MKIKVKVKPASKHNLVQEKLDGSLEVFVTQPAKQGKANQAVIKLLADHFNTTKANIIILKGEKSRNKTISIIE